MKKLIAGALAAAALLFGAATAYGVTPDLDISSDTWCVIDADSGQVLVEKDMDKKKYPASITKILTAGLAAEKGGMDTVITLDKETIYEYIAWGNSTHIALDVGEQLTVRDAMYGALMVSANDAANALAQYVAGSVAAFPELMNAKVKELGLTGTHFTNAHGLPDKDHYTTAYDMAMITRWALQFPDFVAPFCATEYQMASTNLTTRNAWGTYHYMLGSGKYHYDGVLGGKLGWTSDANHTIVTLAERDGVRLICVCMDTSDRIAQYTDTAALFDYCFETYRRVTLPAESLTSFDVPLSTDGGKTSVGVVSVTPASGLSVLLPKGVSLGSLRISYNLPDFFESDPGKLNADVTGPDGALLAQIPLDYTVTSSAPVELPETPARRPVWKTLLLIVGIALASLVFLLFAARFVIRAYYRSRRKKRRKAGSPIRKAKKTE